MPVCPGGWYTGSFSYLFLPLLGFFSCFIGSCFIRRDCEVSSFLLLAAGSSFRPNLSAPFRLSSGFLLLLLGPGAGEGFPMLLLGPGAGMRALWLEVALRIMSFFRSSGRICFPCALPLPKTIGIIIPFWVVPTLTSLAFGSVGVCGGPGCGPLVFNLFVEEAEDAVLVFRQ